MKKIKEDSLSPNSPSFYKGLGIYLKDIQPYPLKAVLLEVSKEPGAAWALVGGILFMLGTITLLILKIKRESYWCNRIKIGRVILTGYRYLWV